jgi:mono/diheme cytochrome c family protein
VLRVKSTIRIVAAALFSILLSAAGGAHAAPDKATEEAKGRILFLRNCSECHGPDATGNGPERDYLAKPPANLRDGKVLSRYGDDEIVAFVRDGKRLRLELRPERVKQHAKETEALYRFVRHLPEIDWEKWEAGEEIFLARCLACHDYYGQPSAMLPEGVKTPRDLSNPEFQAGITDEELMERVRHGKKGMPALVPQLGKDQAKDVVAYVRILSPGYALYDRYCLDCHGMRGEGGTGHLAEATAPEFAFTEEYFDKKSPDEIRKGIWHMLRDKNPSMPHFREALSETEVKAIIRYLRTLPPQLTTTLRTSD